MFSNICEEKCMQAFDDVIEHPFGMNKICKIKKNDSSNVAQISGL